MSGSTKTTGATNTSPTRRSRRGFTLLEVAISCTILAGALLTALTISQAATRASNRAVVAAAREAAAMRVLERLRRIVTRAAASTLRAVPAANYGQGGGADLLPEPLIDGVDYDNLSYREPVGFMDGETVYEPPIDEDPRHIELVLDPDTGVGELVLTDAGRALALADGVTGVAFSRDGDELTIEVTTAAEPEDDARGPLTHRISVAVHAR